MRYKIKQLIEFLDDMKGAINNNPGGLDCDYCPLYEECHKVAEPDRDNCAWEQIKDILYRYESVSK